MPNSISVLTLTYQRHELLEEAIESFLQQDYDGNREMVVINDSPDVRYRCHAKSVRVINHPARFSSILKKIEYGYKQCHYDYVYRLDDDDMLAPWALAVSNESIEANPGFDIYRSSGMYFFVNGAFQDISDNVNNGNIYTRHYLDSLAFGDMSFGEDVFLTFNNGGRVFTSEHDAHTMIYRWGGGHYHVSGFGDMSAEEMRAAVDAHIRERESGLVQLKPRFRRDYYSQLPDRDFQRWNRGLGPQAERPTRRGRFMPLFERIGRGRSGRTGEIPDRP